MRNTYKWWVVAMLWFVCVFNYADRQAIFSVFPLLKQEMNLSDVQLGIVAGAFMWVYAISGPLAGLIGDRINRKVLILSGLIFWSLVTIATALSTTYWHLVLFRALEGLGEAFYFPASMSLISDYHGRETRSRAMALHQSSVYAGTIVGGAVAGYLAQFYGWRSGFYLFGSLGIVLGFALMFFLREPARGQAEAETPAALSGGLRESLAGVFESRMTPVLIAVFVGANFVASIFLTWMPSFLYRKFGMSLAMAGLNATAYLQIASVLGVVSGGVLADRLIRKHRGGRMITQAIGLFLGVPFVFLTGWTVAVPVLVLAMAGFGYFKGMYDANIWASLYDVVKPAHRATALGLMNSIGWLGGGVAPVAVAYASERSFGRYF
jgi:MFS family permease